ncbi:MAG: hypothetical protein AB8G86_04195 [Saprospiraceae bacterium]
MQLDPNKDGNGFNVVVPGFSSGENGALTELFGGRGAVLAEEVFHATQYLKGDVEAVKRNGIFGLKAAKGTTTTLIEADAKIFTSNSGMARLTSNSYVSGYTIPTMAGLIKKENGNRRNVGLILLQGASRIVNSTHGDKSPITINYRKSYSPF